LFQWFRRVDFVQGDRTPACEAKTMCNRLITRGFLSLRRQVLDPGALEQIGELLAGIEHPGLHGALRDADDLAGLFD
jgi:hypothetical protein